VTLKIKYRHILKMNIALEALLRSISVFLGVFFTVSWGRKSKPMWDVALIVLSIILALFLAFRQVIAPPQ